MLAQIVAALYNTGFKSPEKQVSPLDFMPSQAAKRKQDKSAEPGKPVRMTKKKRKELASGANAVLMMLTSSFRK
jgi:hypothetical protein